MKDLNEKLKEYSINDIICLDGTSISPFVLNSYLRCKLGIRCIVKTTKNIKKYTNGKYIYFLHIL